MFKQIGNIGNLEFKFGFWLFSKFRKLLQNSEHWDVSFRKIALSIS